MSRGYVWVLAICFCFVVSSCSPSFNSIRRVQQLEEGIENPVTKEELIEAINKYDSRATDLVQTQAQEGMWYKILGTKYLDEQMYGKALECFVKALEFYPNNANLYYYVGLSAGYVANSVFDADIVDLDSLEKSEQYYLNVSEKAYLKALDIQKDYHKAMYGLGVLYVFEFNRNEDAIPYLERFLEIQDTDVNGMFVLARAYYATLNFSKALDLYDKIIALNPGKEKVYEAQANKKIVLDAQYASQ